MDVSGGKGRRAEEGARVKFRPDVSEAVKIEANLPAEGSLL